MRLSTLTLCALILATPVAAIAQSNAPMQGGGMQAGGMQAGGMHSFFTPEQREMYMEQQRASGGTDWSTMSPDQRHAQMQALRAKFESMSEADKMKLRTDMQAKYDALTPDRKQAVEAKIAARRARMQQMMGGQGQ